MIGGAFGNYNNSTPARVRVARLNSNGTLDSNFATVAGADFNVFALAVQPDNKTIIGGLFDNYDNVGRNGIARVNSDGSLDTTFDPGTGAPSGRLSQRARYCPPGRRQGHSWQLFHEL